MATGITAELHVISARLKAAGERGLTRDMNKGLRSATVFLEAAVREAAARDLPHSGGLARQQSTQDIRTMVLSSSPRTAGVRMRTVTRGSMQTDKGYVRHPVFGRWLKDQDSQQIPRAAGWWTKTLTEQSALGTPLIVAELKKTAAKIQGV